MTQLKVFSLEGCYYSQSAEELLKNNNVNYELKKVSQLEKEAIKNKNNMYTFPQVFLYTGKKDIKVGGYSELNKISDIVNKKNNFDNTLNDIINELNVTQDDKKNVLRLIDILLKK